MSVRRGATLGTKQCAVGTSNLAGSNSYRQLGFDAGNRVLFNLRDSGTNRSLESVSTFGAGDYVNAVAVSRTGAEKALFVNGALEDNTITATKTGGGTHVTIGANGVTSSILNWFSGDIFLAAVLPFVSRLSDSYFRDLSANPWQLFAPRRIWVPQTAISGLPTLSLPTYTPGSLTASGFRPRVTAT